MQQLTPHVYGLLKFGAFMNAYVIDNGGVLTVVDTMFSAGYMNDLKRGLASIGKSLADVQHIFITHCHVDHVGGLVALQKESSATTYAHRLDAPVICGEQMGSLANPAEVGWFGRLLIRVMKPSYVNPPGRVDTLLNGDDALDAILPGAKAIHLPGHSYGQAGLWLPDEAGGTLIGGDVMMRLPRGQHGGLHLPFRMVSPDWGAAKTSVRRVAELNVVNLCLGHGKPLVGSAAPLIQDFAATM